MGDWRPLPQLQSAATGHAAASDHRHSSGELADTELKRVYDANLTLKVTNADDTAGRKLLVFNSELIEAMRMERLVLRGG